MVFKYQLFLDDLPVLEKLKLLKPDHYIDSLTYRTYLIDYENLTHIYMCLHHQTNLQNALFSY